MTMLRSYAVARSEIECVQRMCYQLCNSNVIRLTLRAPSPRSTVAWIVMFEIDPTRTLRRMDDELLDEFEALGAIFDDDFAQTAPRRASATARPSDTVKHVHLRLNFAAPAAYPDQAASVEVDAENSTAFEAAELSELLESLHVYTTEELLGAPMLYAMMEFVGDWLSQRNFEASGEGLHAAMERRKKAADAAADRDRESKRKQALVDAQREHERRRATGTRVTKDTFASWRSKRAALFSRGAVVVVVDEHDDRLTGKEIFERGLATELKVDGDIFADEDPVELEQVLDDLSD